MDDSYQMLSCPERAVSNKLYPYQTRCPGQAMSCIEIDKTYQTSFHRISYRASCIEWMSCIKQALLNTSYESYWTSCIERAVLNGLCVEWFVYRTSFRRMSYQASCIEWSLSYEPYWMSCIKRAVLNELTNEQYRMIDIEQADKNKLIRTSCLAVDCGGIIIVNSM